MRRYALIQVLVVLMGIMMLTFCGCGDEKDGKSVTPSQVSSPNTTAVEIMGHQVQTTLYRYSDGHARLIDTLLARSDVQYETQKFISMGYRLALQYAWVKLGTVDGDSVQEAVITFDDPTDSTNAAHIICDRLIKNPGWSMILLQLSNRDRGNEGYFPLHGYVWAKQRFSIFDNGLTGNSIASKRMGNLVTPADYWECVWDNFRIGCFACGQGCLAAGPFYPECTMSCCTAVLVAALIGC